MRREARGRAWKSMMAPRPSRFAEGAIHLDTWYNDRNSSWEPAMTTIAIVPQTGDAVERSYRAVAGTVHSEGGTVGEALDALTSKVGEPEGTTLVIVQRGCPDSFFSMAQQQRLEELVARWRQARDGKTRLTEDEQA